MPMSADFMKRLFPHLPEIIDRFGTPFHILDEQGILDTGEQLKRCFGDPTYGFQEFFAVKATPIPAVLKTMYEDLGFGLDCSSPWELATARQLGIPGSHIMLTSNGTSDKLFEMALQKPGCILNLDDISMIERVRNFPKKICFRINPGSRRTGNEIIGNPVEAKYGVPYEDIALAYGLAKQRGAEEFGIHTMIVSNELDYRFMVKTVKMLLEVMGLITTSLGIQFSFFNIGGGMGIPYRPIDKVFNMGALEGEIKPLLEQFGLKYGYVPNLFMESGRYMTGPSGVLVATVTYVLKKYRDYIIVNATTMSANPRPAIYSSAYHQITIVDPNGKPRMGNESIFDVCGTLCENSDKFAKERLLPVPQVGDTMVQEDTGAHAIAMGGNYNGWLRPKVLLLGRDGTVSVIQREETLMDLSRRFHIGQDILQLKS